VVAVFDVGLDVDEFGEAEALRAVFAGAAVVASDFAEVFEAAVLEFPAVVLDAVFLLPVVFDAVLSFFSAITPLP